MTIYIFIILKKPQYFPQRTNPYLLSSFFSKKSINLSIMGFKTPSNIVCMNPSCQAPLFVDYSGHIRGKASRDVNWEGELYRWQI